MGGAGCHPERSEWAQGDSQYLQVSGVKPGGMTSDMPPDGG